MFVHDFPRAAQILVKFFKRVAFKWLLVFVTWLAFFFGKTGSCGLLIHGRNLVCANGRVKKRGVSDVPESPREKLLGRNMLPLRATGLLLICLSTQLPPDSRRDSAGGSFCYRVD